MKYDVLISRTGYSSRRFEVEAENEMYAEELAMEMAGDYEFVEGDAEYNCESITPIEEPDADEDENDVDEEVERLAEAYNALTCAQKDEFLRLTGNE